MKKIFLSLLFLITISYGNVTVFAQSEVNQVVQEKTIQNGTIEVLKPKADTQVKPGDTIFFALKRTGKEAAATLAATVSGPGYAAKNFVIGTNIRSNIFSWKIPSNIENGTYVIEITSSKTQSVTSLPLKVYQKKKLELLLPDGTERFNVGDTINIKWSSTMPKNAAVGLFISDSRRQNYFAQIPGNQKWLTNTGSYTWKIPEKIGELNLGGDGVYRISISSTYGNSEFTGRNEKMFSIVTPESGLKITSPAVQSPARIHTLTTSANFLDIPLFSFALVGGSSTSTVKSISIGAISSSSNNINPTYPVNVSINEKGTGSLVALGVMSEKKVFFDNLESKLLLLPKQIKEYSVLVSLPSNTKDGTVLTGYLDKVIPGQHTSVAGTSISLPYYGNPLTIRNEIAHPGVPVYHLASALNQASIRINKSDNTGTSSFAVATFPLTVTAVGGDINKPAISDFEASFIEEGTQEKFRPTGFSVVAVPDVQTLKQDGDMKITVTVSIPTSMLKNGTYNAKLNALKGPGFFETYNGINVTNSTGKLIRNTAQTASVFEPVAKFFKSLFGI